MPSPTINDQIITKLTGLGYTGSINDKLFAYYKSFAVGNLVPIADWASTDPTFTVLRGTAIVDAITFAGESVYKFTCDGLNTGNSHLRLLLPASRIAVVAGRTYTIAVDFRIAVGSAVNYRVSLGAVRSDLGAAIAITDSAPIIANSATWTTLTYTFVASSNCAWVDIILWYSQNSLAADVWYARKLSMVEGTIPSQIAPVTLSSTVDTCSDFRRFSKLLSDGLASKFPLDVLS